MSLCHHISRPTIFKDSISGFLKLLQRQTPQDDVWYEYAGKGFVFAKLCFYLKIKKSFVLFFFLIIEACLFFLLGEKFLQCPQSCNYIREIIHTGSSKEKFVICFKIEIPFIFFQFKWIKNFHIRGSTNKLPSHVSTFLDISTNTKSHRVTASIPSNWKHKVSNLNKPQSFLDNNQFHCVSLADDNWAINDKDFIVCPSPF